jgi:hypothetical protein
MPGRRERQHQRNEATDLHAGEYGEFPLETLHKNSPYRQPDRRRFRWGERPREPARPVQRPITASIHDDKHGSLL